MTDPDPAKVGSAAAALLREARGPDLPWYDSLWLRCFIRVRTYLVENAPDRVGDLDRLVAPLRTPPSFETRLVPGFLTADQLNPLRLAVDTIARQPLSTYERNSFGRDLIHDRFTDLQHELTERVGEMVGEAVEPYYNFLSLYGPDGVCAPHLDAPEAKWTVDICIDQSAAWPLHISPVASWPVDWDPADNERWQDVIRSSHRFDSFTMSPGDAIVFAGSSQWHYRDPWHGQPGDFCRLLFLHYIPAGCAERVDPTNWPAALDLAELAPLCHDQRTRHEITGSS